MKKSLFAIVLLLFLSCGGANSDTATNGDIRRNLITDLDEFYLDQLSNNQMLLLGESKHNDQVANQAVISFLSSWLDDVEGGNDVPGKVTLVIEYTQDFGEQLQQFFVDSDVSHLGIEIQGRTLNTLEFFYDLKDFYDRAIKMSANQGIEFKVFCPEESIPFDASREEQMRIAFTERDNNTAASILDYMRQHPDHKLIAFYGGGHTVRKERPDYPTTPWGVQVKQQGVDTYVISLNHFYDQMPFTLPFSEIDSDFVLANQSIKRFYPEVSLAGDAHAFYKEPYVQTVTLKDIPSVLVIRKALEYAKASPRFIPAVVSLWHRYTGEDISGSDDIVAYAEANVSKINTVAAIDDLSLFDNILAEFAASNTPRRDVDKLMFEITCFSNILNRKPYPLSPNQSAEELWKAIIAKYQKPIKAGLYTSLLFYGTADEKAAAESRLKELSGKSLHTSKEWLDYSRRLWSES